MWFAPASPRNLGAARIVVAAHALWILLSRDLPALSGLPAPFWTAVPASARWRFLVFEGRPGLEAWLQWAAVAALVAVLLGVGARASSLVAGLLLYHLAPLETLFLSPTPWIKGFTVSVPALIALSLSPCGDALSLWRTARGTTPRAVSDYGWPLRLIQLGVCQIYLFGGYAKLFHSGGGWASPANIRSWLLRANQDDQMVVFDRLGPWIADRPTLCLLAGASTLALELGFVTVLFSRRSRRWLVPVIVAFHTGVLLAMNYAFLYVPLLLVFVDWDRVAERLTLLRAFSYHPTQGGSHDPGQRTARPRGESDAGAPGLRTAHHPGHDGAGDPEQLPDHPVHGQLVGHHDVLRSHRALAG